MKKCLVIGAGGFIGSHLVKQLRACGAHTTGVDIKHPEFSLTAAHIFHTMDASKIQIPLGKFDEIYQLAADMGGAGYIFTGEHDANVMANNAAININVLDCCRKAGFKGKIFYSSSACIYPAYNQSDPQNPICSEESAYPANPDSDYGWEKLFSERLFQAYNRNYGIDIRIARFHNVFGEEGTYKGGREKSPAALCRKVSEAVDGTGIEIWGTGEQTRSYIYIKDCLDGVQKLMESEHKEPINIGSEEMVTIQNLAEMIIQISGKKLDISHVDGPVGVMGRNSDNKICRKILRWEPRTTLVKGLEKTYYWIKGLTEKTTNG